MFVFFLSSSFVLWGFLVFLLHNFLLFRHVDKERPKPVPLTFVSSSASLFECFLSASWRLRVSVWHYLFFSTWGRVLFSPFLFFFFFCKVERMRQTH